MTEHPTTAEVELAAETTTDEDPEYETAIHEAGHALAAHLLGFEIDHTMIGPDRDDEDSLGLCLLTEEIRNSVDIEDADFEAPSGGADVDPETRQLIDRHVMYTLAGMTIAEAMTGPEARNRADSDHYSAFRLAMRITGSNDEANAYLQWMRRRTESLTQHPLFLPCASAVADALLERKTLTGREFAEVIGRLKGSHSSAPVTPVGPM